MAVSEAAQKRPAETPKRTPRARGPWAAARRTAASARYRGDPDRARVPRRSSEWASIAAALERRREKGEPERGQRRRRSTRAWSPGGRRGDRAVTVSSTRPPAITDCTSEIGASESAPTWKPQRHQSRSGSRACTSASETAPATCAPGGAAPRRRLDRATVLVEEADDRRERGRDREQQADLDREAQATVGGGSESGSGSAGRIVPARGLGAGLFPRSSARISSGARASRSSWIARIACSSGSFVQHLLDQRMDLGLVVPEVVEQRAQRGVRDLELLRGQLEVVVEGLARLRLP